MSMVERLKIGLIYSYNTNWIAGAYYILNLVHALNKQPDAEKPELYILSQTLEEFDSVKATGYPYLVFCQLNENDLWISYTLFERSINKISRAIINRNFYERRQAEKRFEPKIDVLFPAEKNKYFSVIPNKLYWIPDFQEHYLPEFFSAEEIQARKINHQELIDQYAPIVFSSKDVLDSFKQLYPTAKSNSHVLPFAVTHPVFSIENINEVLEKFEISGSYFFCPNQVWAHKNHITVLKAINYLRGRGKSVKVIFSGKQHDYRNPDFFNELRSYIRINHLEEYCKFLGFIDRVEQLQLMKNAIAILQPSLFEGWSTSIEDAKAMNQYIIASDLPVHKEQLGDNALFFERKNEIQLAGLLENITYKKNTLPPFNYDKDVAKFGAKFLKIVGELVKEVIK